MEQQLSFRYAESRDTALIWRYITELADYEGLKHEVTATEELLEEWLFDKQKAEVIFARENGREIGFAFLGRGGLYLEDLYIQPEFRGRGYGKSTMEKLAHIAVERGCGRLEWWCLDRNQPSIEFYLSLGAVPMSEWTVYRISGDTLSELAEGASSGC